MIVRSQMSQQPFSKSRQEQGSTFLLVLGLGLIMTLMGMGLMIQALKGSAIASGRKDTGKVGAIADGGIARTLSLLKQPQNAALLTRNYDLINPRTGRHYLGADSALNSGDETGTAIDEWTGYDPSSQPCYQQAGVGAPNIPTSGTIGANGTYTLLAYRYNPQQQLGTVLVEARSAGQASAIVVSFKVNPILDNFPGVLIQNPYAGGADGEGKLILRRRNILGQNAHIYYPPNSSNNPSLNGVSVPGDVNRNNYLNAIFSSAFTPSDPDPISGNIFACRLTPNWPVTYQGTNLGDITTSRTLTGTAGSITHYQVNTINLTHSSTLRVDTTAGPVYLYIRGNGGPEASNVNLRGTSKILNIRTDGKPPRVGDFRLISNIHNHVTLYDQSCIQETFLYLPIDSISLLTTGGGCPSASNSNFVGVLWVEALKNAKNNVSDPNIPYTDGLELFNTTVIPNVTSGITVPNDVSSLTDILSYIDWPIRYQFGEIKSWSRQRL